MLKTTVENRTISLYNTVKRSFKFQHMLPKKTTNVPSIRHIVLPIATIITCLTLPFDHPETVQKEIIRQLKLSPREQFFLPSDLTQLAIRCYLCCYSVV